MIDYFSDLQNKLCKNSNIEVVFSDIIEFKMNNTFDLFRLGISNEAKYIYNNYKKFILTWEDNIEKLRGLVNFVPYEELLKEHEEMLEITKNLEDNLIEDQEKVITDLKNWYPIFKFPNGDAFCYDNRNGYVVFFEHEVFDTGINLNGLIIAESIGVLLDKWSKILFIDIYDWCEGVNELGMDLSKPIYKKIIQKSQCLH